MRIRDTIQPTLREVAESRPPHGSGAPARTRSHYQRIRTLLFERGDIGVDASELYAHPELYGRSPRNRISELRADLKKEGSVYMISGKAKGSSDWHYRLIRANSPDWFICENSTPAPHRPQLRKPEPPRTLFDVSRDAL